MMTNTNLKGINGIAMLTVFTLVFFGMGLCLGATSTATVSHDSAQMVSLSLISQDPDPAMAGGVLDLRFGLENQGGQTAENVVMEIVPEYPFESLSGSDAVINVGTISPYQADSDMQIVKYSLKVNSEATAENYQVKVLVYEAGQKSAFSTQKVFEVSVGSQTSAEIAYIDKTELVPGKQTPIRFVVRNVGSSPLKKVTFSWSSSGDTVLPVGSDNTKYIDYLGVGQDMAMDYNVTADAAASAGLYKLNLSLSYEDALTSAKKSTSSVAGIYIGGGTDFDVAFSESSSSQISLSVANIGSNPATSVSMIIPKQDGWIVSGSNSAIIGNLNKGDYTIASFNLASGNSRSSTLKVDIQYTDTRGERQIIESSVDLSGVVGNATSAFSARNGSFSNRTSQRTNGGAMGGMGNLSQGMSGIVTIAIYVVAGIIILIVAYVLYKRRKSKKAALAKKHILDEDSQRLNGQKVRK